jgi:hypothetical protein
MPSAIDGITEEGGDIQPGADKTSSLVWLWV